MEIKTALNLSSKLQKDTIINSQSTDQQQKLRGISCLVKNLKNTDNNQIFCYFSWLEIKKQTIFLLDYLSREKITDRILFFDTLASFDSLLSIFKVNLFMQLKFQRSFYRNIQRQFEFLCLQFEQCSQEKRQKVLQFQLYSILFLLVMLIYFSGKKEHAQNKDLPLNIINKSFINNFISLEINITLKNQRIIGLIVAYLIKNINIKIYGQKMLKFILNHFDKIQNPRTLYHFVYCLREIHVERQIDIKSIRKYGLIQKLINFWVQSFYNAQSIYLVDYINVILKKYSSLVFLLKVQPLLIKLYDFEKMTEFSIIHQGLILQIKAKLLPSTQSHYKQKLFEKAYQTCQNLEYSLKFLSCFANNQSLDEIMNNIFPFLNSFQYICKHKQMKNILFSIEILNHLVQICLKNNAYSLLYAMKQVSDPILVELKEFQICRRDISIIEKNFSKLISIQQQLLC